MAMTAASLSRLTVSHVFQLGVLEVRFGRLPPTCSGFFCLQAEFDYPLAVRFRKPARAATLQLAYVARHTALIAPRFASQSDGQKSKLFPHVT